VRACGFTGSAGSSIEGVVFTTSSSRPALASARGTRTTSAMAIINANRI
jgi:hypothetical protein